MRQAWHHDGAIALERPARRHDVDIEAEAAKRLIPAEGEFRIREVAALRLDLGDPRGLVVKDEGDGSLPRLRERLEGNQLARHLSSLHAARRERPVRAVQARMHLLLRK